MVPILNHRNRHLFLDQTSLITNALEETFLTADIAAASSTITVASINGLAVNQILIINPFSERNGEIILTHASSAPSGTTVTLKAATTTAFAHYAGEKVFRIEFDQVETSQATTATGSKTVLATSNLQGDQRTYT